MIMRYVFALLIPYALLAASDSLSAALASRRYQEALEIADVQVKAHPADPRLWTARGIALEGLGRMRESIESFSRALAIDAKFVPALEGSSEAAYASRDPRAEEFVVRLLVVQPNNQTAHAMAGALAFERRDCGTAATHFEKSHREIENSAPALAQFGECLVKLKRASDAAGVFEHLLALNPASETARYNLGLSQLMAERPRDAIATLQPLRTNPDALNLLAAAEENQGQMEAAIADFRRATELAPTEERNYLDLAILCLDHDAFDLALDVIETGLRNIPDSARLYTMRGAVRAQTADFEKAAADFEKAERLKPDQLYGSVGLSMLLRQEDRLSESISLLREKLKKAPADPTLNYLLADALMRQGAEPAQPEFAEARQALLRSLRAKPDFDKAHAALGKTYLKSGETENAIREFRWASKSDPTDRTALQQLLLALHKSGREQEAAATAAKLKSLLDEDRKAEVARNRIRLVKAQP